MCEESRFDSAWTGRGTSLLCVVTLWAAMGKVDFCAPGLCLIVAPSPWRRPGEVGRYSRDFLYLVLATPPSSSPSLLPPALHCSTLSTGTRLQPVSKRKEARDAWQTPNHPSKPTAPFPVRPAFLVLLQNEVLSPQMVFFSPSVSKMQHCLVRASHCPALSLLILFPW